MGPSAPAVFALEKISVEKKKITEAQTKTGNQFRRSSLVLPNRAGHKQLFHGNPRSLIAGARTGTDELYLARDCG
jgi:hypothetical protein